MPAEGLIPCRLELPRTAPDDLRIGHLITRGSSGHTPRIILLGFPCDIGVQRNHGRTGAAAGPTEIRRRLYAMTPDPRSGGGFLEFLARIQDWGDVAVEGMDLETAQERLGQVVAEALAKGARVIVLGGGHETAYGHFLGYARTHDSPDLQLDILNWDAHADVRPYPDGGHSGSPFRQILEHPRASSVRYTVAGLLGHSVAAKHLEFVNSRGNAIFAEDLADDLIANLYRGNSRRLMVSFDLDAVDQAFAPGVSAPGCGGLHPETWLLAARLAGECERVRSVDIVELNPLLDRDGQTARLAALTVCSFLYGDFRRAVPDG